MLGEHRCILGTCRKRTCFEARTADFAASFGSGCHGQDRSAIRATTRVDPARHRPAACTAVARIACGDASATTRSQHSIHSDADHDHRTTCRASRRRADHRPATRFAAARGVDAATSPAAFGCFAGDRNHARSTNRTCAAARASLQPGRWVARPGRINAVAVTRPARTPKCILHAARRRARELARFSCAPRHFTTRRRRCHRKGDQRIDCRSCRSA